MTCCLDKMQHLFFRSIRWQLFLFLIIQKIQIIHCQSCNSSLDCKHDPFRPVCVQSICSACYLAPSQCFDKDPRTSMCLSSGECVVCTNSKQCHSILSNYSMCDKNTGACHLDQSKTKCTTCDGSKRNVAEYTLHIQIY